VADPAKLPPAIVPTSAGLSEARLRQIHGELAAAKRQLNQADAVSLDALSKSLRESEKRISAQHPGRTVDFHVVVKDGKPVVKPIVRK
jgi:electron transfer flavoprotein alpha/beta subunit